MTISHANLSNRSINKALTASGLRWVKTKGGTATYLTADGQTVSVFASDTHKKNTATTFKRICEVLGMTIDEFAVFARTCEPVPKPGPNSVGDALRVAFKEQSEGREAEEFARAVERAQRAQEAVDGIVRDVAPPAPEPTPEPEPEDKRQPVGSGVRQQMVIDYVRTHQPCGTPQIAEAVGTTTGHTAVICSRLVYKGVFERPSRGLYVLAQKEEPVEKEKAAARLRVTPTRDEDEETIWEVLDLLFPDGIRARNMPAVERWKTATLALMKEIRQ